MKALSFLLGKWESHEKAKGPGGTEVSFTLKGTNAFILDGKGLQIDEAFEVEGRKFANHILMTHDAAAGKYKAWWFTAGQPSRPLVFSGVLSEKAFILTTDDDRVRISYDLIKDGEYKAKLEVKRNDAWETTTTAEYKRTGA